MVLRDASASKKKYVYSFVGKLLEELGELTRKKPQNSFGSVLDHFSYVPTSPEKSPH